MDILIFIILLVIAWYLYYINSNLAALMMVHKQTGTAYLRVQETSDDKLVNTSLKSKPLESNNPYS